MFNTLTRHGAAIVGAGFMLAGCGEYYVYDEEIIKALKSQEGVFRLDEVFGDYEWSWICYVQDYQRTSRAVAAGTDQTARSFEYVPRNYYMDEGHVGIALVDQKAQQIVSFPIPRREINRIDGPQCLARAEAFAKLRFHPNKVYGDDWSLLFIGGTVNSAKRES